MCTREWQSLYGTNWPAHLSIVSRRQAFRTLSGWAADISGGSSDVSFASAVGGGVDLKLAPIIGWRFQGDYIHTHFFGQPQGHARISTGVVFRF
jgi:hypothetical protein